MRPRLLYIVTHPMSARYLLRGQLGAMQARGFDVHVIAAPGADLDAVREREGVRVHPVPMAREIDPASDLRALWKLYETIRRIQPDLVNAGTPKAGLLGMVAAWCARVPVRVYMLRGLRLETAQGLQRALLTATERIAAACAHRVLAVSPSLADTYVARGLARREKVTVLGAGSSNGIDLARYGPGPERCREAEALRAQLSLPKEVPVIGFVGRFTRDKGIEALVEAFERVLQHVPEARLLLLGDFEVGDPVAAPVAERIRAHPQILTPGFVPDTAPYYLLMDVLSFPSRREGFPNVPLEAAASGVPTVGVRATGTVDAVVDGQTGRLVPVGDVDQFAEALLDYITDDALRARHGRAARERVADHFRSEIVWGRLFRWYGDLLLAAGRPLPEAALGYVAP